LPFVLRDEHESITPAPSHQGVIVLIPGLNVHGPYDLAALQCRSERGPMLLGHARVNEQPYAALPNRLSNPSAAAT
jgi:hypothetical protein